MHSALLRRLDWMLGGVEARLEEKPRLLVVGVLDWI